MKMLNIAGYWGSLLTALILQRSFSVSIANDRPVHSLLAALAECALLIWSSSKVIPELFAPPAIKHGRVILSLDDLSALPETFRSKPVWDAETRRSGRVRRSLLAATVLALTLRIELYRRLSRETECSVSSFEIWLPVLIVCYDSLRFREKVHVDTNPSPRSVIDPSFWPKFCRDNLMRRWRDLIPSILLCYGAHLALQLWQAVNSTYICPIVTDRRYVVSIMQIGCLAIDLSLAIIVTEMSPRSDGSGLSPRKIAILWSFTMTGTALIWSVVGGVLYIFKPVCRIWLLLLDVPSPLETLAAISSQAILFSVFCTLTLHSIVIYGILHMALALVAVCTLLPSIFFIWNSPDPFPPVSPALATSSIFLMFVGWWSFSKLQQSAGIAERGRLPVPKILLLVAVLAAFPSWVKPSSLDVHPIDLLMRDAKLRHDAYTRLVEHNGSLTESVAKYREKYNRNPPPGFGVWFSYAMNRSSLIVDEFDRIYEDMLPFYSVSPATLRTQTWEMVSNPWNEISGISVRNGRAIVQENVIPTHRWMLEGVVVMINKFAEHLPDMDMAFNLNDEARVVVPYGRLASHLARAKLVGKRGTRPFSETRSEGWLNTSKEEFHTTVFHDLAFRNTFSKYGSIGCPASSVARRYPRIASQLSICRTCVAPHSIGQFVSNWSLAGDICHQPDMQYLHGFYLSPAAFRNSHELVPVFSQSKPHGYSDILYPTAWNYMDKIAYSPTEPSGAPVGEDFKPGNPDPPFQAKKNTMFWRGATSEGVSSGQHTWRGMTRQRLVHLTNNATFASHDRVTILLPDPANPKRFKYQVVPGPVIHTLGLSTDISIVDKIARCGGVGLHDCTDQANEFALAPALDFQQHWAYRFLFDLDGAAFSGRFLPFLQSHSLPFKTALFREWYDSRLTAWHHFVPQDGRLHGMWSTLAYFAGVNGTLNGKRVKWEAHLKEGEMIAEGGRDWANKVLRKEDMELYFFRLLLEWGRLTDDDRENLGFVMD